MSNDDHNSRARRVDAHNIFLAALRAVDPLAAVSRAVIAGDRHIVIAGSEISSAARPRRIVAVSMGKAAYTMAAGLDRALGPNLFSGIAVGPSAGATPNALTALSRWQCFTGGHPLPTGDSLRAGRAIVEFVRAHDSEDNAIVFLISGGGSAMVELPIEATITVGDLSHLNFLLLTSGAPITEINIIRRALSAVKGGRLAATAPGAAQASLIVSDTPPDEMASVASGPTIPPAADGLTPRDVLARFDLLDRVPPSIRSAIDREPALSHQPLPVASAAYQVILQNADALNGAAARARKLGYEVQVVDAISDQEIAVGCRALVASVSASDLSQPLCILSGGEFSCPVRGMGRGGRSAESALRIAVAARELGLNTGFTALCAGTDGIDGNSPAAGAVVDEMTLQRAEALCLRADDFLARSDSFAFFDALGDIVSTGPTGTNVRDVRILLVYPRA